MDGSYSDLFVSSLTRDVLLLTYTCYTCIIPLTATPPETTTDTKPKETVSSMELMYTGGEAQWSQTGYADHEFDKYDAVHQYQHGIWTGPELTALTIRSNSLLSPVIDSRRSTSNEGRSLLNPPPLFQCTYPAHGAFSAEQPTREWAAKYEASRTLRYMSPNWPHGSSISGSSSSSESAYTSDAQSYPIRYSESPVNAPRQYTFKAFEIPSSNHMPWPTECPTSYTTFDVHQNVPYVSTQSSYDPKVLELQQHDDIVLEGSFDSEVIHVQEDSLMHRLEPEELELTLVNTESSASSTSEVRLYSEAEQSDEELSDMESMAVDNDHADSDPDYENQPRRRTNTRSTTSANKHSLRSPRSQHHTRRASRLSQSTILGATSRVHKSGPSSNASSSTSTHHRRPSKSKSKPKPEFARRLAETVKQEAMSKKDRTFPCTFHHFGCTSEFPNKNEWKRHVAYQHLQLGYFRCDLDGCDPDNSVSRSNARRTSSAKSKAEQNDDLDEIVKVYNDFNRKDLFTQHCRRMHGPSRNPSLCSNPPTKRGTLQPTKEDEAAFEKMLENIRKRCWHVRRKAPERSSCGFCLRIFEAEQYQNESSNCSQKDEMSPEEKAWEARMEHLGRHYEKENITRTPEDVDEDLVEWGINNGLLHKLETGKAWLVNLGVPDVGDATVQGVLTYGDDAMEEYRARYPRKTKRQPSKTVEIHRKRELKEEIEVKKEDESDSDDDAEGESDPAVPA